MFSQIGQAIFDHQEILEASDFKMGLEIEMQRVDETGHLSQEPYPAAVGDEKENPWITNDFLETMSEIVTPPAGNATMRSTICTALIPPYARRSPRESCCGRRQCRQFCPVIARRSQLPRPVRKRKSTSRSGSSAIRFPRGPRPAPTST